MKIALYQIWILIILISICGFVTSKIMYVVKEVDYLNFTRISPDDQLVIKVFLPGLTEIERKNDCVSECMRTEGCNSIEVYLQQCNLRKYDMETIGFIVGNKKLNGFNQYDIKNSTDLHPTLTHFQKCRLENSCKVCGRGDNCLGPDCKKCANFCWEMTRREGPERLTFIYDHVSSYTTVICRGKWQRIWITGDSIISDSFGLLNLENLKLKVLLFYDGGSFLDIYFENVTISDYQTRLSVGKQIVGTGDDRYDNYWKAPFTEREILKPKDTNCLPFFYPEDPCPQENTKSKAGFIWPVGSPITGTTKNIRHITLWVTDINL